VTALRWVCLSDTHFGAENSILSPLSSGFPTVDPDGESAVLTDLVECLRALVSCSADGGRPRLVLHGDVLEMALAQDNVAGMVFERFVDLAFAGPSPVFDDTITYVPGNHDHHLWETARERQYAAYVERRAPGEVLEPPWHVTTMVPSTKAPYPEAELLTALVRRRSASPVRIEVAYPNFGIVPEEDGRAVVVHHGHFVEPLYRLMSTVRTDLFPRQAPGPEIWDWEADNFAWIDFFWSTLGRSGDAGDDVGLVYDMLRDPAAVGLLAANLAGAVAGTLPRWARPGARLVAPSLVRRTARSVARRERADPSALLSASGERGLSEFLAGPLRRQVERECPRLLGLDVSFVFGHTHKPFERRQTVAPFGRPLSVFNTGGWVVDTMAAAPLQGAAAVLVDDRGAVASLRLYNQGDDAGGYAVVLSPPVAEHHHEFDDMLRRRLDLSSPPWTSLSRSIAAAVARRHEALPAIVERGKALAARPRRW